MSQFRLTKSTLRGVDSFSGSFTDTINVSSERRSDVSVTRVATSTTVATLAADNPNRRWVRIHNEDGTNTLFVKFGTGASSTSFTVSVARGAAYEHAGPYTGIITGTLSTGSNNAQVTEVS